jgi:hypothetical protein
MKKQTKKIARLLEVVKETPICRNQQKSLKGGIDPCTECMRTAFAAEQCWFVCGW